MNFMKLFGEKEKEDVETTKRTDMPLVDSSLLESSTASLIESKHLTFNIDGGEYIYWLRHGQGEITFADYLSDGHQINIEIRHNLHVIVGGHGLSAGADKDYLLRSLEPVFVHLDELQRQFLLKQRRILDQASLRKVYEADAEEAAVYLVSDNARERYVASLRIKELKDEESRRSNRWDR